MAGMLVQHTKVTTLGWAHCETTQAHTLAATLKAADRQQHKQ